MCRAQVAAILMQYDANVNSISITFLQTKPNQTKPQTKFYILLISLLFFFHQIITFFSIWYVIIFWWYRIRWKDSIYSSLTSLIPSATPTVSVCCCCGFSSFSSTKNSFENCLISFVLFIHVGHVCAMCVCVCAVCITSNSLQKLFECNRAHVNLRFVNLTKILFSDMELVSFSFSFAFFLLACLRACCVFCSLSSCITSKTWQKLLVSL